MFKYNENENSCILYCCFYFYNIDAKNDTERIKFQLHQNHKFWPMGNFYFIFLLNISIHLNYSFDFFIEANRHIKTQLLTIFKRF